jgi:hypothetical protein
MKKYEDILETRKNNETQSLMKIETVDERALTEVKSVEEALALAGNYVPAVQKKILASEIGLPAERKEKWLKTIDENLHDMEIVPQRRTMTEKKLAVLQTNRHPTAGAKFHQAVLESSAYAGMLMSEVLSYEKQKIKLEKKFYFYKKKVEELEQKKEQGEDTFILEKNLEIKRLTLTQDIIDLKNSEKSLQNKREELIEWSELKEELYREAMAKNEIWSPDAVDGEAGLQEIPLILRHFQNFIILKTQPAESGGGDISSVLNIEGLALTAFEEGLKKNKLGLYVSQLKDEHIKILWLHLYGKQVEIKRIPSYILFGFDDGTSDMCFPTNLNNWQEFNKIIKEQSQKTE